MAIRTVVTRGYANGTFSGTIALVVTRGYGIGEVSVAPDPPFIDHSFRILRTLDHEFTVNRTLDASFVVTRTIDHEFRRG